MTPVLSAWSWARWPSWKRQTEESVKPYKCAECSCQGRKLKSSMWNVIHVAKDNISYLWIIHFCVISVESCNLSSALQGLVLPTRLFFFFFFWSFFLLLWAVKPQSDVITGKWRYFGAQLSFIWILSSSLVLGKCWQMEFLVPSFWVKPCHCWRPTKEWFI